ncbi:glycoside hydrolase family 20 protein [Streptomyces sp. MST-110588]|uniref:beta-N-acetylhexosaminidase n=1 Tax=Streptomyces sp. MST-110588 TaxID=2833628 RepID=UPI001F5D64E4|nr:glycoside hydrolase family 20 protein [Streptomyces sp. MST-110588]UNO40275.1 family 20 glycosylhydrolase [Streptomyces sp. MST-110588]
MADGRGLGRGPRGLLREPRDPSSGGDSKAATATSAAPTPTWAPVTGPPHAIPAVRAFHPGQGRGWRPTKTARIVVPAGEQSPLADEARLLARDLGGLRTIWSAPGRETVRPGDIELRQADGPDPEAYTLTARDTRLTLTAPTDAGIFYGTRTVLQSVRASGGVPEGTVEDRPDRPQRGLSLDIARKHFPAQWIEDRIRELADLKFNQLQLHFSDDQGFRIESERHPEVVSPDHLTKAQVRHLVELARGLHVTVIPEIDSPGHLGAVLKAHPHLRLTGSDGGTVRGAIDISRPEAAGLVDDLLREYAPLFPGAHWHLGGDEYAALTTRSPEASYPGLAQAAREKYGPSATVRDLATGWLNDRDHTLRAAGARTTEAWNDGYFPGGTIAPEPKRTVAYWTGKEIGAREPADYLDEGRRVVNLNDEYLYYVLGEPNEFRYPTGERIYKEWTPAVLRGTRPLPASRTGPDRVLGARFAVWCDFSGAQTPDQIAHGIRMPLRALSQKVWNPDRPPLSWKDFKALADRL